MHFVSEQHRQTFDDVLSSLQGLGYGDALLQRRYQFPDWFAPGNPSREVPAAAFATHPPTYHSACFAVLVPNGKAGSELVHDVRALGAPIALEVRARDVIQWKVGRTPWDTKEVARFPAAALRRVFEDHRTEWSSGSILRAKGIMPQRGGYQLDFVDLGLIPALEGEIQTKLDRILREVLADAIISYKDRTRRDPDHQRLYRLVFRCLAAKIFHDRDVSAFSVPFKPAHVRTILDEVAEYYSVGSVAVLRDAATQSLVAEHIWSGVNFQNLSADVLAYIYEKTLVTENARKDRGIHGTPFRLARYVVHHLPFEDVVESQRRVLEPCCGHAVFLLAALQRLRDLLQPGLSERNRHRYLVQMLRGYDVDPFALEVGHLCLLLADFPNKNGWSLERADVYRSTEFTNELSRARFVLCNPPFENFPKSERHAAHQSVHKPVALLKRVLEHLHPEGMLGFVLPRKLLDGSGYRDVRRDLAVRFRSIEVVALPDNVFAESGIESALLIAKEPHTGARTTLHFSHVKRDDSRQFLDFYEPSWSAEDEITPDPAVDSLCLPPGLLSLWRHLKLFPTLASAAKMIHRGIEWQPTTPANRRVRDRPANGYELGIENASSERLRYAFELPEPRYLMTQKTALVGDRDQYPWSFPKVSMNAARKSRGYWCIVAFVDDHGLITSQRFQNIWPAGYWTAGCLAAVLNGPIANLYLALHENKRDLHVTRIRKIPLPKLTTKEIDRLDGQVEEYVRASKTAMPGDVRVRDLLLEIDATVLAGYELPITLLHELLAFVQGQRRPVPFDFAYPSEFADMVMARATAPEDAAPSLAYELPEQLLTEYHALLDKSLDGELSRDEAERLGELRERIYQMHMDTPLVRETDAHARAKHKQSKRELTAILKQLRDM